MNLGTPTPIIQNFHIVISQYRDIYVYIEKDIDNQLDKTNNRHN